MREDDLNSVTLSLPAPNMRESRSLEVMKLNKDDLRELIEPLRPLLAGRRLEFTPGSDTGVCNVLSDFVLNGHNARIYKEEFARTYLSFSSDPANVIALAVLEPSLEKCWELILNSPDTSSTTVEQILGRKLVVRRGPYWRSDAHVECTFYPLNAERDTRSYRTMWGRESNDVYVLSIRPETRRQLAGMLLGKSAVDAEVCGSLPGGQDFITVDFENHISSDLTYLSALGMTGNPLTTARGTLTAAKMKAIKKDFPTGEFPPLGEEYPLDRIELLTWAFFTLCEKTKNLSALAAPGSFAKEVLKYIAGSLTASQFEMFLPAFKGFSKSWTETSDAQGVAELAAALLRPSADGWMSLFNLRLRYLCCDLPASGRWRGDDYVSLFPEDARSKNTLKRRSDELDPYGNRSQNIRWFDEVDFPFLLHWIEFLCAVGIVEIAFSGEEGLYDTDSLEGLRYVRLTSLGRYAFGIDAEYNAPAAVDACELDVDDANGILTVMGGRCPYSLFLRQISVAIGSTRFRITPESILKGCADRTELQERIDNLKNIVEVDKTVNLRATVAEALRRTECVEKVKGGYRMLRVDRGLPGFISLLLSDKEIRDNTIMAENSIILVKTSFLPRFKEICASHGYLADV